MADSRPAAAARAPDSSRLRARRARAGVLVRIERIPASSSPRGAGWRPGGSRRRRHRLLPRPAFLLHAPQLILELLIAILQLLDLAGQSTDLAFELIQPDENIGARGLRAGWLRKRAAERDEPEKAEHMHHGVWPGHSLVETRGASRRNCDLSFAWQPQATFNRARRRRGQTSQRRTCRLGAEAPRDAVTSGL